MSSKFKEQEQNLITLKSAYALVGYNTQKIMTHVQKYISLDCAIVYNALAGFLKSYWIENA